MEPIYVVTAGFRVFGISQKHQRSRDWEFHRMRIPEKFTLIYFQKLLICHEQNHPHPHSHRPSGSGHKTIFIFFIFSLIKTRFALQAAAGYQSEENK